MVLKSTPTNPDALVPPFRSSVDQVYHEMAPIGHYNLEEASNMVFSCYCLHRLLLSSRKIKHKDARTLSNQKNQTITFTSDSKLKNPARHVLRPYVAV